VIATPRELINQYLDHRARREAQILEALADGAVTPADVVARVYRDTDPALHQLAELSVLAHLEKLEVERLVERQRYGYHIVRSGQ
jgi:hypothetical protein